MILPSVSIVMTPRDRRAQLDSTLESIFAQNYPDLEIVIVEDRPQEASLEFYCKRNGIKYAARRNKLEGWVNPAPLLNHGILMSTKEILIIQNAECRHEGPTTIVDMVTPIVESDIIPLSVCAYVQSLNRDGSFNEWLVHPNEGGRAGWLSYFCQAVPRKYVMKIQGFEEEFKEYGYEDDMFEFMLRNSGVRLTTVDTLVSHQWHPRYTGGLPINGQRIFKRIKEEITVGIRPCVANYNKPWGNI